MTNHWIMCIVVMLALVSYRVSEINSNLGRIAIVMERTK